MAYKLNPEDENPLWRNYMNNVDMNNPEWLKKVDFKTSQPANSFSTYSEDEFLEKLKTDKEFNKKWG
jgi:hypothetical protein